MTIHRRTLLKSGAVLAGGAVSGRAFGGRRGLSQTDYANADAVGLAEMVRSKQIGPTDALEAAGLPKHTAKVVGGVIGALA